MTADPRIPFLIDELDDACARAFRRGLDPETIAAHALTYALKRHVAANGARVTAGVLLGLADQLLDPAPPAGPAR